MLLTEEQAEERLNSENNLANRFGNSSRAPQVLEKVIKIPGKDKGSSNLSIEERTEIATRARLGESQGKLAKEFNVTQPNISSIERGKTKGIDEEQVEGTINKVRDKALDRLMTSLGFLTDDKLSGCSAKDLATIASNMGRVVEKTMPRAEAPDKINLIIYTPELKSEKSFNVIEIGR